MRHRHPDKDIDEAVAYALRAGWTLKQGRGHAWGILRCPYNDDACRCGQYCQMSVWSTPRNARNHARTLKQKVDGCIRASDDDD